MDSRCPRRKPLLPQLSRGSKSLPPKPPLRRVLGSVPLRSFTGEAISGFKYALVWTVYVLIGSWLFLVFERTYTKQMVEHTTWTRYKELLKTSVGSATVMEELRDLQDLLYVICPHPALLLTDANSSTHDNRSIQPTLNLSQAPSSNMTGVGDIEDHCSTALKVIKYITVDSDWSYVDAVYYTMTLVTTIGYGNIYPATRVGRLFAVLYAMLGVPLTCILMAKNSNILSMKMLQLYERLKKKYSSDNGKLLLYAVATVYLSIGFIVFMFLPSLGFVYMQGWTYDESLYFTFITLSTIGFGDLIAGYGSSGPFSDWYKIAIVIWIMIALGYWVLLLNFLQRAVKKKIVPKRIRVQFKARQLAKQAEFLRQLMTKVREQAHHEKLDAPPKLPEETRKAMSLMAEATGNFGPLARRPSGVRRSLSVADLCSHNRASHASSCSSCCLSCASETSSLDGSSFCAHEQKPSESETNQPQQQVISLTDLMNASVVLRTAKVPIIKTLIDCSKEDKLPSVPERTGLGRTGSIQESLLAGADGRKESFSRKGTGHKEVTLPLRDVLGLVTIVANLEGHLDNGNSLRRRMGDASNTSLASMVSMDAKMPSLREVFAKMKVVHEKDETQRRTSTPDRLVGRYRQVSLDDPKPSSRMNRRGSCLDAFLDGQTKREYIEVGEERPRCKSESLMEDTDTQDLGDDETFSPDDTIISLEDAYETEDDEEPEDDEEEGEDDEEEEEEEDDEEGEESETKSEKCGEEVDDVDDMTQDLRSDSPSAEDRSGDRKRTDSMV